MAPSTRVLDAHTNKLYDLGDVYNEMATTKAGRAQAERLVTQALGAAIEADPRAATKILGPGMTAGLKAAAAIVTKAAPRDIIDQALDRLRASATTAAQTQGDAVVAKLIEALAAQLAPPVGGHVTVTDSGRQSTIKGKARQPDLLAATIAKNFNGNT